MGFDVSGFYCALISGLDLQLLFAVVGSVLGFGILGFANLDCVVGCCFGNLVLFSVYYVGLLFCLCSGLVSCGACFRGELIWVDMMRSFCVLLFSIIVLLSFDGFVDFCLI